MRNRNKPSKTYVTWLSPKGLQTRSFTSPHEARRFAFRLNSPGVEITHSWSNRKAS
jgi:hypothetical protein